MKTESRRKEGSLWIILNSGGSIACICVYMTEKSWKKRTQRMLSKGNEDKIRRQRLHRQDWRTTCRMPLSHTTPLSILRAHTRECIWWNRTRRHQGERKTELLWALVHTCMFQLIFLIRLNRHRICVSFRW